MKIKQALNIQRQEKNKYNDTMVETFTIHELINKVCHLNGQQ